MLDVVATLGAAVVAAVTMVSDPGAGGSAMPVRATIGAPVALKLRQRAHMDQAQLTIEFRAVVTDSRCPEGARCVREGEAIIAVVVTMRTGAKKSTRLQTAPAESAEASIDGYRIALVKLEPRPTVDTPLRPADYVATLLVTVAP